MIQPFHGCAAGLRIVGLDSEGNVRGCESLYGSRFIEGNLRERSLRSIWQDPGSFAYNRRFHLSALTGRCAGCPHGPACAGGCRSFNAFHGALYENVNCAWTPDEEKKGPDPLPDVKTPRTWLVTPLYIGACAGLIIICISVTCCYAAFADGGAVDVQKYLNRMMILSGCLIPLGGMAVFELFRQSRRKREPFFQKGLCFYRQGDDRQARLWFKYAANMGHREAWEYVGRVDRLNRQGPGSTPE